MFLLDTVILSEMRKRDRNGGVVAFLDPVRSTDLYLSVVTVGEVERGIQRQRGIDPAFAGVLATWLDEVLNDFADRVLPFDVATARRWGRLAASAGHAGADLMIAATALENGLAVVTRNVRHFAPTGVKVIDPFSA